MSHIEFPADPIWKDGSTDPEGVDHVCRGCQAFIGDDGKLLCDDCADRALDLYIAIMEQRAPCIGICRKCGKKSHGKDQSGLCYSCWR